jgi:Cu(I)/Ag(I) efflux system membrane fusion protein
MHPEIKVPHKQEYGPGNKPKCPKCFMELVPVTDEGSSIDESKPILTLSKTAQELAEIEVEPVQLRELLHSIQLVGKVVYDETRLSHVSAWVPGRIDKLYVNFTGARVSKGDHLTNVYSPDLRTAQEEYLIAVKRLEEITSNNNTLEIDSTRKIVEATRKKLELWGMLSGQIEELKKNGKADDHTTVHAPIGGIVISKEAFEGKYVATGERLFTIADIKTVWVYLNAYELDVPWIHYGQKVEFEAEAYLGTTFTGRIAFISPSVNEETRTIDLRANVVNTGEKLKPGMFVRAKISSRFSMGGFLYDTELSGKWISPMHPEIIKDAPGSCDICGMELVPVEKYGYAPKNEQFKILAIPETAPLVTGKRAIVYVKTEIDGNIVFEGREVRLGPRAGEYYPVIDGLKEGELVVTKGNFKIDSAIQIRAKPSMMSQPVKEIHEPHREASHPALTEIFTTYFKMQSALSKSEDKKLIEAQKKLYEEVTKLSVGEHGKEFDNFVQIMKELVTPHLAHLDKNVRVEAFAKISATLASYLKAFGHMYPKTIYEIFCPMAFDEKGAIWLQEDDSIQNPYLSETMPTCGSVKNQYTSSKN